MNKSSLLLVTTILLGLIGQSMSAQWTRGYEASIYWGSGNRLQNSRETPRNSGVYQVNFGFKMRDIPQVMLNPNIYDWQNGMPTNWELTIEEITTEYFKYKITTTSPRELYTIFFNWIAVVGEESLQVKYIKLKTNELAKSPANGD